MTASAKTLKYKALQDALKIKFADACPDYFNGRMSCVTVNQCINDLITIELGRYAQARLDHTITMYCNLRPLYREILLAAAGRMLCYLCLYASVEDEPFVIADEFDECSQLDTPAAVIMEYVQAETSVRAYAVCELATQMPSITRTDVENAFLAEADKILAEA